MLDNNKNVIIDNEERIDKVDKKISLIQKKDGFAYGTDAVLLASYMRKNTKGTAVEFGAGKGIVSLLCEEYNKFKKIYAVEVQEEYYDLLCKNIEYNDSSVLALNKDIREMSSIDLQGEADVVFSNPPYMKTDSGRANFNEGKNTARHEVKGGIFDFCRSASKILKHGGLFYCVYRPDRAIDLICAMRENLLEPKRMTFVYPYVGARACLMLVEAKKGASSSVFTTKPFIIFNSITQNNNDITDDMKKVYEECDMDDEFKLL